MTEPDHARYRGRHNHQAPATARHSRPPTSQICEPVLRPAVLVFGTAWLAWRSRRPVQLRAADVEALLPGTSSVPWPAVPDDRELLAALAARPDSAHRAAAVALLFDRYAARLYDYATVVLGESAAAEIVHDVLIDAVCRAPRLRDHTYLAVWLYGAVRRKLGSRFARRSRTGRHSSQRPVPVQDDPQPARAPLSTGQRELLLLAGRHSLTLQQLAALLGRPRRQVQTRLERVSSAACSDSHAAADLAALLAAPAAPELPHGLRERVVHTATDPALRGYRAVVSARAGFLTAEALPRQADSPSPALKLGRMAAARVSAGSTVTFLLASARVSAPLAVMLPLLITPATTPFTTPTTTRHAPPLQRPAADLGLGDHPPALLAPPAPTAPTAAPPAPTAAPGGPAHSGQTSGAAPPPANPSSPPTGASARQQHGLSLPLQPPLSLPLPSLSHALPLPALPLPPLPIQTPLTKVPVEIPPLPQPLAGLQSSLPGGLLNPPAKP